MKPRNKIKMIIVLLTLAILTLTSTAIFIYLEQQKEIKEFIDYKVNLKTLNLTIVEKEDCYKEKILYYEDEVGQKYYTSCLEKIIENNGYDLKKLLINKKITFEDIFSTYKQKPIVFYDGGSKEYYYQNLNIIKCHTINGNNDIIIGNKVLSLSEGHCYDYFEIHGKGVCSFTKTYFIKKKYKAVDDKMKIVVSQDHGREANVLVNKYPGEYFKVGKYYEFTFDNNQELIKDATIEDIFENYSLRAYSEIDSTLENQIEEKVCKPVSQELIKKAYNYLNKEDKEVFKNLYATEALYKDINKLVLYNKKNKKITLKNQEVLIVYFTKEINNLPNDTSVVIDSKTKEVLGIILED